MKKIAVVYWSRTGNTAAIRKVTSGILEVLGTEPLAELEYVEIVRWDDLKKIDKIDGPVLAAIAVRIGRTRLIDSRTAIPLCQATT